MIISELDDSSCHLGEGPVWDAAAGALYWVDSYGPTLYRYASDHGETERWQLPGKQIGSIALRERGGLILAMDQGFYAFEPDSGALETIALPIAWKLATCG